jgi:hypothetical protein
MLGGRALFVLGWACLNVVACSGPQQGYYDACAEPAGLALGCEVPPADELTSFDACMKLASCGVIDTQDEDDDDDMTPTIFERCIDEVEASEEAVGDTVLVCIAETSCPDLARVDPATTMMDDPNPSNDAIEGIIGYCGRLDPG